MIAICQNFKDFCTAQGYKLNIITRYATNDDTAFSLIVLATEEMINRAPRGVEGL